MPVGAQIHNLHADQMISKGFHVTQVQCPLWLHTRVQHEEPGFKLSLIGSIRIVFAEWNGLI